MEISFDFLFVANLGKNLVKSFSLRVCFMSDFLWVKKRGPSAKLGLWVTKHL